MVLLELEVYGKNSKKGIVDWAKKTLYTLMNNPIPKIIEGEDRVLR